MTATFDPTLPLARDRIRLSIGDHTFGAEPETALRTDETIDAVLLSTGDWRLAVAELAEGLAAEYGQEPSTFTATGDMSVAWADRVSAWLELAKRMRSAFDVELGMSAGLTSVRPSRNFIPDGEYRGMERFDEYE